MRTSRRTGDGLSSWRAILIGRREGIDRLAATAAVALLAVPMMSCAPQASQDADKQTAGSTQLRNAGVIGTRHGPATAPPSANEAPAFGAARSTHPIEDKQLGMVASQVTVPADWTFEGSTAHDAGCARPGDTVSYRAESPDGTFAVERDGGYLFGMTATPQVNALSQQRGCIMFGSTIQSFLKDVWLPRMRPGAQVEVAEPLPDDFPPLRQIRQQVAQGGPPPPGSSQQSRSVTGGRVKVRYIKYGRPVEEEITAIATCIETLEQGRPVAIDCTAAPVIAVRAPAGRLDAMVGPLLNQIVVLAQNPAYNQQIDLIASQRNRAQQAQAQATIADGQAMTARTLARIRGDQQALLARGQANLDTIHRTGAAIMNNERNSAAALHASSQAFSRSMGNQAQFTTPSGRTFNASNQYGHTYVDGQGHVMQTNSAYPPGPGWTETQGR